MKSKRILLSISFFCLGNIMLAQRHTHETKPSTARVEWGDFAEGELIKLSKVDYKRTPIAKKILKKGVLRKGFEYVDSIEIHSIVYESDGLMVTGFMVKPKAEGTYPCIIYNRGGNRDMGSLLVGTAAIYMGKVAAEGYVVIASNYRGNSNSEGKEEFGGSDVNDVLNLIPALAQLEGADTSRIGMLGISRGGMMTYLAIKNNPRIKAAVVIGGMSNLFTMKKNRPDMETHVYAELIPNYENDLENQLVKRSAAYWSDELPKSSKFLLLHGSDDKAVSIEEARELHARFEANNIQHVFIEYGNDNHGIHKHSTHVSAQVATWFDKYVKNGMAFDEEANRISIP